MDNLDQKKAIFLFLFIFTYSVALYIYAYRPSPVITKPIQIQLLTTLPPIKKTERVLITYVWADTDVQSLGNLEFFIRYGLNASQPADYYFILQKLDKKPINESRLPVLPPNAHYIQHDNECYDIGTMGWFISQNITNTTLYKYFIFMNSSIRGPFLVPYFEDVGIWWFEILTRRLTDEIKLVGPTINCEQRAHVQSYLMATDQVGLTLFKGNQSSVFRCHGSHQAAVFDGEIAASQLLLHANYQIASLQSKYQGWDFRKSEYAGCNYGGSPIFRDDAMDEINHDPFELIFVKYKDKPPFDTIIERRALVYKKWLDERPRLPGKNATNSTKIG